MATSCGYEFKLEHLRFESAEESNFYEFQWTKKKLYFVLYRAFTFCYHWGWLIASWVLADDDITYTLSNWSFFFTGIYYLISFIVALYGIIARNGGETSDANRGELRFFHKINWLFHIQAMDFMIFVVVLYWAILAPGLSLETLQKPLGQHKHSVQGGLLLIDMFLIAIPTRWLHTVYNMLFAFFYVMCVVIVHFANIESRIYGFLDLENSRGISAGVLIASVLVAPIILHTITFALYHARMAIYRCTVGKQETAEPSAKFEAAHDNVAFDA